MCVENEICSVPRVENGEFRLVGSRWSFSPANVLKNTVIGLFCQPGFVPSTFHQILCYQKETFYPDPPSCIPESSVSKSEEEIRKCSQLEVEHGTTLEATQIGGEVEIVCDTGYVNQGFTRRACLGNVSANPEWYPREPPFCLSLDQAGLNKAKPASEEISVRKISNNFH